MFPWIKDVTDEERRQADAITRELLDLGARPHGMEVLEAVHFGYAPVARYLLARRLWRVAGYDGEPGEWWSYVWRTDVAQDPERYSVKAAHSLRRILDAGVDPEDLKRVVREIVFDVCSDVAGVLEQERDPEEADDLPGWRVMEIDAHGQLTGRVVGGLPREVVEAMPDHWLDDGAAGGVA